MENISIIALETTKFNEMILFLASMINIRLIIVGDSSLTLMEVVGPPVSSVTTKI